MLATWTVAVLSSFLGWNAVLSSLLWPERQLPSAYVTSLFLPVCIDLEIGDVISTSLRTVGCLPSGRHRAAAVRCSLLWPECSSHFFALAGMPASFCLRHFPFPSGLH